MRRGEDLIGYSSPGNDFRCISFSILDKVNLKESGVKTLPLALMVIIKILPHGSPLPDRTRRHGT